MGEVVKAKAKKVNCPSVEVVEALAMKEAISFISNYSILNTTIKSDAKMVVEAIHTATEEGLDEIKWDLRAIIEEICLTLSGK